MPSIGTRGAMIVSISEARHLYWRADGTKFVTVCDDGNVIYNGHVMSLQTAAALLSEESKDGL